jgi:hypothetical protein
MLLNTQSADFEQLFEAAPISLWLQRLQGAVGPLAQ